MNNPVIVAHNLNRWYDSDGKFHRDNGPAVIYPNGDEEWYQHGDLHRTDGPAIECANGRKFWVLNDQFLAFEIWLDEVDIPDEKRL
jgi:hypothetical protein|tara:strand:- start:645 stop:902 length:258 start_codon:yes stop_codon:yes gene_type:complete